MRSDSSNFSHACPEWQSEIESILNTELDSEIRQSWESHAKTCTECTMLMETDREITDLISELPVPLHTGIAAEVMAQISTRPEKPLELKTRHVVWGFSTAIIGFILGFVMSGLSLEPSHAAGTEDYFEETLMGLDTGVDSLVTAFVQYDEELSDE